PKRVGNVKIERSLHLTTWTVPISSPPSLGDERVPGSDIVIPLGMGLLFLSGLCTLYVIFRTVSRWKTTQRSLPMALRVPFYIALSGRPWPEDDCRLIGGATFFLVACNMILVGSLAMLTFLRICRKWYIDLGKYDYKLFAFLISLSFVLSMVGIPSFGSSKYWCFTNKGSMIMPIVTLALNFTILAITIFCYAMTLREINSIQLKKERKATRFDTVTSNNKKIEPIVVRKIIGYVLIFIFQWTPSMIYVFGQIIGYDEMWVYLVTDATVNLGGIGNMIQYIINEGWRNDPNSNINDDELSAVIVPSPSTMDLNSPSTAPTISLPFHHSKIKVEELVTIKIDPKSRTIVHDSQSDYSSSPTIVPSIASKVDILKNQRKDDILMKQQHKIIVKHNDDVIRHGGMIARQTSTTKDTEQTLKTFRKSMKKNKNNRNDTVSWHRFGSGPNSRSSIRGLLQRKNTIEIIFDDNICIMHGLPEESDGCKLKGKVLLTNSKRLKVKSFNFTFIGKTNVNCGPFISSSRPEYNESHTLCRRECLFPSPSQILPGVHEFQFEVDLPGHLPASFKGTRGKIEYWCYVTVARPMFHADISLKKPVIIQRSLLPKDILASPTTIQDHLTTFTEGILDEKVQYSINAPIMAFREGGLVSIQLVLKPLNSDIILKSVEYGLKELVHYHKSGAYDDVHDINSTIKEDKFPLGKKLITLNNNSNQIDPGNVEINFRLCPRIGNSYSINNESRTQSLPAPPIPPLSRSAPSNNDFSFHFNSLTLTDTNFIQLPHSDLNFIQNSRTTSTSYLDVNVRQSQTSSESSFSNPILNNSNDHYIESSQHIGFNNHTIQKEIISHKKELSLEIPLIITTKSSYNYYSTRISARSMSLRSDMGNNLLNIQDYGSSPPYSMLEEPPAYMYAALVPPPPRYNQS
ncbi:19491_t:CDS:2, partial [Cetraspora pellucida]